MSKAGVRAMIARMAVDADFAEAVQASPRVAIAEGFDVDETELDGIAAPEGDTDATMQLLTTRLSSSALFPSLGRGGGHPGDAPLDDTVDLFA